MNLINPVAKQRGSNLVIIDVRKHDLGEDEMLEFSMALAKFYNSNFWMKFKSISMMAWLATALLGILHHYKSYYNPKTAMAKWKETVFLMLEVTDLGKDLMYLFF